MTEPGIIDRAKILIQQELDVRPELTIWNLSIRAGLGKDTVHRWMTGTREPRISDLETVLKLLGHGITITRTPPTF